MKLPQRPPSLNELLREMAGSAQFESILEMNWTEVQGDDRYLHWDKLRYLRPPKDLTHREWWLALKLRLATLSKQIPLCDPAGKAFRYLLPDPAPEYLHKIDLGACGSVQDPDPITNTETRDRYHVSSLIEEAFTSSQLEGAASTRQVAKEMIRSKRKPQTEGERMILNNYVTMRRIGEIKTLPLTPELVCELHRLITRDTLKDAGDAGRIRTPDHLVVVDDYYGQVLHDPPPAEQLAQRMQDLCDFANATIPDHFIHPVIRSIIVHFWLAYDHPFIDGNGRTARALFYWSMLKYGFWLFEFVSISSVILKAPVQYGRAFLYTETDDNDLTYFILYHLTVIMNAIEELHRYVEQKTLDSKEVEAQLHGSAILNHRQQALISHALRHPNHRYTIASHRVSHNVVYETARTDLLKLCDLGLLEDRKIGRVIFFTPRPDLPKLLGQL